MAEISSSFSETSSISVDIHCERGAHGFHNQGCHGRRRPARNERRTGVDLQPGGLWDRYASPGQRKAALLSDEGGSRGHTSTASPPGLGCWQKSITAVKCCAWQGYSAREFRGGVGGESTPWAARTRNHPTKSRFGGPPGEGAEDVPPGGYRSCSRPFVFILKAPDRDSYRAAYCVPLLVVEGHKKCFATLFKLCAGIQEDFDDLRATVVGSGRQQCGPSIPIPKLNVCTRLQQNGDYLSARVILGGPHHWGPTLFATSPNVHTGLQQPLSDLTVSVAIYRPGQRGPTKRVLSLGVSPCLHERCQNRGATVAASGMQGYNRILWIDRE